MSQFAYEINEDFSVVALTQNPLPLVDINCIMLDNYRGLFGTITVHKETGEPGSRIMVPIDYTGEHGWTDFCRQYGFAIVPNDPTDRSAVIKLINK
jgi:hypothetical protein